MCSEWEQYMVTKRDSLSSIYGSLSLWFLSLIIYLKNDVWVKKVQQAECLLSMQAMLGTISNTTTDPLSSARKEPCV